jgi:putative transcriptional regulator
MRSVALLLAGAAGLLAQSRSVEDLAAGAILVTPRNAADPLFAKSVILLVSYGEKGAVGLMVNRQTDMPISRALRSVPGAAGNSDHAFVGGPVQLDTVFALNRGTHKPEGSTEVAGDIYLITARPALEKALSGTTNPSGFRVYLGYCGWAPRQLENEMRHNIWYIFRRGEDLAFDDTPPTLWSRLVDKAEGEAARLFLAPGYIR